MWTTFATKEHEIFKQGVLWFSDSSKPGKSVSLIHELAWLAGIHKSDENLLNTSCKVEPVTKVAYIFWWRHATRKQSASAHEYWCNVSCDIPYCLYHFFPNLPWLSLLLPLPILLHITFAPNIFLQSFCIVVISGTFTFVRAMAYWFNKCSKLRIEKSINEWITNTS